MSYCQHCGAAITTDARFCAYCGAALELPVTTSQATAVLSSQTTAVGDYSVILLSQGACSRNEAVRLITAACGYTGEEALLLVETAPVTLARELPRLQAVCLAQALTEKGMEVSLCDSDGYQELIETDDETLFDKVGNFIASAATALGLIGARHRVPRSAIRRMELPAGPDHRPPVLHVRRRQPAPKPQPAHRPQPASPARNSATMRRPEPAQPRRSQEGPARPANHAAHRGAGQGPNRQPGHDGPGGGHGRR